MTRIIGIVLLQNEENFVTWAISNSIDFCDEMIVIDNNSTDATWERIEALARRYPKIRLFKDGNAAGTNAYLQEYIGKDVWVFGVDGDEIYDREGLSRLRSRILVGEFRQYWKVRGFTLHATVVDLERDTALGYLTPSAAAATKLYNFAHVVEWTPERQRLHGFPVISSGFEGARRWLATEETWTETDFRDLHMCFFPRSSIDAEVTIRKNITDKFFKHTWRRAVLKLLYGLGGPRLRSYIAKRSMLIKQGIYMGGDIAEVPLGGAFGRPTDFVELDPLGISTERVIERISKERRAQPDLRTEREKQHGFGSKVD